MKFPVFITTFNRLACLKDLVDWLERAGQDEIYFVDNLSSYPPMVRYLHHSPHTWIHSDSNIGNRAPWKTEAIKDHSDGRYFVVTDPDIVPTEDCELDAFDYFFHVLENEPKAKKVGFSLKLDDIPDHYNWKDKAVGRHRTYQEAGSVFDGNVVPGPVDAIMSLYRPASEHTSAGYRSMRHQARHTSWYDDLDNPDEELEFYQKVCIPTLGGWSLTKEPK